MAYIVVHIKNKKPKKSANDILIAYLNEMEYEAFEEHLDGVDAYILQEHFSKEALDKLQSAVPSLDFIYEWEFLEDKNWNEEWEQNYKAVVVGGKLLIRSTFHEPMPEVPHEIIINPQMSFGTGHHETTTLMLEAILSIDLAGKKVLDVGCGTGILAIFAAKQGAFVTAVDIDENAYENALCNLNLNGVEAKVALSKGTVDKVKNEEDFDVILANINRNVLLQDIPKYAKRLRHNGILLLSGFYESDVAKMEIALQKEMLRNCEKKVLNEWTLLKVQK